MKKSLSAFIILFQLFTVSLFAQKTCEMPPVISLRWEMGVNGAEKNYYSNQFTIKNRSTKTLENNWTLYFNQMPRHIKHDPLLPVTITEINAGYYKITPSVNYKALRPNDSIVVTFLSSNGLIKEAHAPSGAFIVLTNNDKELAPQSVAIEVVPFSKKEQWNRPNASELPYPKGEVVYLHNEQINSGTANPDNIFPSLKEYTKSGLRLLLGNGVSITATSEFANEKGLLARQLHEQYGIAVTEKGGVLVTFEKLPAGFITKNNEHYRLLIEPIGVRIQGNSAHAIFNGMQTLLALLKNNEATKTLACGIVNDYPDLLYRGQMIDVARNFMHKESILRLIDLFSSYKLNTIHLHICDDEGWRLQIPGLEELTTVASRRGYTKDERSCLYPSYGSGFDPNNPLSSGNGFYTTADFIEILKYAQARHVRIIPEVDVPGHARAAIVAMKARYHNYIKTDRKKAEEFLLSDWKDVSKYTSAQGYNDNVINIAMPSTYRFIEKVTKEIVGLYRSANVPLETLHFGGDEVPKGAWLGSPIFNEFNKTAKLDGEQFNPYFFKKVDAIISKYGLSLSGWQEMALTHKEEPKNDLLGKTKYVYCWNTVVDWGGDVIPYKLANAGYDIVLSNLGNFYFDLAYNKHQSERGLHWAGFVSEINSFDMQPFNMYHSNRQTFKGVPTNLATINDGKPSLNASAKERIKGVQGQVWTENITSIQQMEYALFPKMFGLIERGWNAYPEWANNSDLTVEKRNYTTALSNYLAQIGTYELPYLNKRGLNFRIDQPGIVVKEGQLYMNSTVPNSEIRYTTDGSEPTAQSTLWSKAVPYQGGQVKARTFYCGKKSVVTRLVE